MVIPWDGFALAKLVAIAETKAEAKFIQFNSFLDPKECPGQRSEDFPWPYTEGLTLPEAANKLAFLATGLYGKPLANQNGGAHPPGGSLEIRFQGGKIASPHRLCDRAAKDPVERVCSERVRPSHARRLVSAMRSDLAEQSKGSVWEGSQIMPNFVPHPTKEV
jgi:hypothetical protein